MTTTPAAWKRVQGDVNDTLVAQLDGVASLSAVTSIEAHVWRSGVAPTTLTATVLDATNRTVTVNLSPWLATATATVWNIEIQATSGATVQTWPNGTPATLSVRAQGA